MWGIDNLAQRSLEKSKYGVKNLENMTLDEKLECIKVIKRVLYF